MSVHSALTWQLFVCSCECLCIVCLEKVKKMYVCREVCQVFSEVSVLIVWVTCSIRGICQRRHPYWLSDTLAALRTVSARGTHAHRANSTSTATSNNATQHPNVIFYYSVIESASRGNKRCTDILETTKGKQHCLAQLWRTTKKNLNLTKPFSFFYLIFLKSVDKLRV